MKIFWIIGSVLLILVVISLGLFIPLCNKKISAIQGDITKLEFDRDMRFRNLQWFLGHDLREGQIVIETYLLNLLKEKNAFKLTESKRKQQIQKSLSKLHTALTGEIATEELKKKWTKMDIKQLHNEVKHLIEKQDFTDLYDNMKDKKTDLAKAESLRVSVLVLTTVIQVVGLLMISVSQYFKDYIKKEST